MLPLFALGLILLGSALKTAGDRWEAQATVLAVLVGSLAAARIWQRPADPARVQKAAGRLIMVAMRTSQASLAVFAAWGILAVLGAAPAAATLLHAVALSFTAATMLVFARGALLPRTVTE